MPIQAKGYGSADGPHWERDKRRTPLEVKQYYKYLFRKNKCGCFYFVRYPINMSLGENRTRIYTYILNLTRIAGVNL